MALPFSRPTLHNRQLEMPHHFHTHTRSLNKWRFVIVIVLSDVCRLCHMNILVHFVDEYLVNVLGLKKKIYNLTVYIVELQNCNISTPCVPFNLCMALTEAGSRLLVAIMLTRCSWIV